MPQQDEHRDQVSKAIFDTGYKYGAISKAYDAHEIQQQPPELAAAFEHADHANKLLYVVLRDAEQAEKHYPWGEAARRFADAVALATAEYTAVLHDNLDIGP